MYPVRTEKVWLPESWANLRPTSYHRETNAFVFKRSITGSEWGRSLLLGLKATEKPTYCYDLHATLLHLLGIDHTRLTYRHNGIDRRLTDVHGRVVSELLA